MIITFYLFSFYQIAHSDSRFFFQLTFFHAKTNVQKKYEISTTKIHIVNRKLNIDTV